ncbi:MAG: HD-GYP domain-containing protein [Nitrospirota bacterium]
MKLSSPKENSMNLVLNILFLLSSLSLFFFFKNMFYLHIIAISLMILMLVKCYYQGIRNGMFWLGLIVLPFVISMFKDSVLSSNELSEILLVLVPSATVGLLAEKQRRYIKQLKETYIATLKALAETTDARDSYTQGHSERVAKHAVLIAKEMLLAERQIYYLEQAALLHDIGKIAVPDTILHKTGPLNEEEWVIMKKHPEYSQKIVSNLNFLSETIPTILYHHKRFDNKGYPFGELEGKMPVTAGILAVADAFDAMTTDRTYRNKLSLEQALEELEKGAGTQFDPNVVKAFKGYLHASLLL